MRFRRNIGRKEDKDLSQKKRLFFRNEFWENKINFWLVLVSLAINIVNWLLLLIFLRPATENIILHYNVYFGVDMIGKRVQALFLPGIGLIIFIINFFLAVYFFRNKEIVATYILLGCILMAQLSLIVASLSVIIINY